ncbi:aminoglycoside phosphotransferase family protein [Nocardioides sp. J2M5]|uniref:aminoglycoside phosphotransferase family protein n=1 Tax=Nocardioides palaemonis TaxID=2829810 RepID=UPI001BA8058F|nr:aminoglycoside phosphotransferase family protein [Nocardioides palaemonis]MBS2937702.1 aminoglycoside phosphotransferase family protein [Nocardioides palaemonis]
MQPPVQTSTHQVSLGETEVRKAYVADHEDEAEREWACLTLLAEHAPGLAPRPLRREDAETPVIVMERLPGAHLAPEPLTAAQVAAVGTALRRLHDVPVGAVEAAGIGPRGIGTATLPPALVDRLSPGHDLSACEDPALVRAARDAARDWLRDPSLPELRAEVLGIADLNPPNVIWDGRAARLVDFEDAGLSDPAYELADHVEHLGSRLPGVYDADALADAVGLDGEQRERMAAYRPFWAAFWLAMLTPGSGSWHRNPPGTVEAQAGHFMALVGRH